MLVVLRSSSQVEISVGTPGGKTLASAGAVTPGLGLVVALTHPVAGSYQASADGQGSVFAAELLRYVAVTAPSPGQSATSRPAQDVPRPAARPGPQSDVWLLGVVLALVALALIGLAGWRVTARRRPKGTLVVWWGSLSCLLDPADLNGPVRLEDLFDEGGEPTGWSVSWTSRAPVAFGPDGSAVRLAPDETRTVPTVPLATLTWFPDGTDSSLSDEPPGRPASALPPPLSPPA